MYSEPKRCNILWIKTTEICKCQSGYTGSLCQKGIFCGNCAAKNCNKDGTCTKCPTGWTGSECSQRICAGINMCGAHGLNFLNSGTCVMNRTRRQCACKPHWTGEYCREAICDNYDCGNGKN